jgi:hypothetical protein
LKPLIRVLQLLNPLIFLTHCSSLPIVLGDKVFVGVVDLVTLPGLVPDLFNLIPQAIQLVALVNYDLPLALVGVHDLRELFEAKLGQSELFLEALSLVPL